MAAVITHAERMQRARRSLDGLSVGDAFGNNFFASPQMVERLIELRAVPASPWCFTDDTVMAISIVDVLEETQHIEPDLLARYFAARYHQDDCRGYGGTAHDILRRIFDGEPWREVAASVFGGGGSMGNGGAMRSAPVGAYFYDDLPRAAAEAQQSAVVTHAHPEGQAGAMAVAVAAAWIAAGGVSPADLFDAVLTHTPPGATHVGIQRAAQLPLEYDLRTAASALGNGTQVISQDTVPFSLWCAARHLGNFEQAMWTTVAGLGDRDTTCAIVGGIVAMSSSATIPADWLAAREPLETMSRSLILPLIS